ncbi:TPA: Ig-like domain-containing protein [Vibrio parahaemolyticus]
MDKRKIWLIMLFSVAVSGCKQEDSMSPTLSQPEKIVSLHTQDITRMVKPHSRALVSIDRDVIASDRYASVKLLNVEPLTRNQGCQITNIDDTQFEIQTQNPTACSFKYTVSTEQNQTPMIASAYSRVLVQEETAVNSASLGSFTLPPKSIAMDAQSCSTIALEDVIPNGASLQQNVDVIGSGVVNDIDSSMNKLNYCVEEAGYNRLFYNAYDVNTNQYYIGTVLVGVSGEGNQPPEVGSFSYYYDPGNMIRAVPAYEEVTIDVSDFISDPEGDSLQIIDIQVTDASATAFDTENLNNKKITFLAKTPGQYYVNYMVSDHNGGYGVGVIDVRASSPIKDYYYDTGNERSSFTLSAPVVQSISDKYGFNYQNTQTIDGFVSEPLDIALFDAKTANAYCKAKGGRLPSEEEVQLITQKVSNQLAESATWPKDLNYWLQDVGTQEISIYQDNRASISVGGENQVASVSCLNLNIRDFEIRDPFYIITGTYKDLEVKYTNSAGENTFYTKGLTWTTSDPSVLTVNTTTGRAVGRSKGSAVITATTRDGKYTHSRVVEVIDEIFMFGMGSLNDMYYNGFNSAVEVDPVYKRTIAANAVLKSKRNFGPDGKVGLDATWVFETARDYRYGDLRAALDRDYPPAVVHIGYPNRPDAVTTNRLRDFLYDGGVLMYFTQENAPTRNIMYAVFGDQVKYGTTSAAGGVFQFKDIDDPLLNGAFGDIRNKYWGVDQWYVSYVHNLPKNSYVAYSNGNDVSGNSQPREGDAAITALRHKKLKFVWTGDAGFIGFNVLGTPPNTSRTAYPFNVKNYKFNFDDPEADWTPVAKPNYGRGTRYDVSNSIFFANAITWLFGADNHGED